MNLLAMDFLFTSVKSPYADRFRRELGEIMVINANNTCKDAFPCESVAECGMEG